MHYTSCLSSLRRAALTLPLLSIAPQAEASTAPSPRTLHFPARSKPDTPNAPKIPRAEHIVVTTSRHALAGGGGMMRAETAPRATQTVTKSYIDMRSPTSTTLDLISFLPSVNVTPADTSGMQGGQFQSRGLTDLDTGLLLDGAPAAAAKYLHQNIDSENIQEVTITPGSASTGIPVTAAAGGVLVTRSITPSHQAGGFADATYGTNNLSRQYLRLQSGDIGNSGVRGYLSFSNAHARTWMGAGVNNRRHLDLGILKDWANGSYIRAFASWNNEYYVIDNYPTAQEFYLYKNTGQGYGRSADPTNPNYWKISGDYWNQVFTTTSAHVVLRPNLSLDLQPYLLYSTGYDGAPQGQAVLPSGQTRNVVGYFDQLGTRTVGVIAKLNLAVGTHNMFSLGYWYENAYTLQSYPTSYVLPDGNIANPKNLNFRISSPDRQDAGYELHSIFIEDTAKYLDGHLTIHGGFKFVMTNLWNRDFYGAQGANRVEPLPQLQVGYQINTKNQIYINAEADYRQPSQIDMGWLYTSVPIVKNEHTIKEELGWRYHGNLLVSDVSLFNYNVSGRIVDQYIGLDSYRPFSIGSEQISGTDILVSTHPFHGFSPYASFEYLYSRQDSNVEDPYTNTLIHSSGSQVIMAPKFMANLGGSYESGHLFGNVSLHYTGPQSVSIAGDQRMPGYITNTIAIGYHFSDIGAMKHPTIRFNFTNITGSIVRTGALGAVYSGHDPSVVWSGSQPSYTGYGNSFFVVPRFTIGGTLSSSF